ncbi:hypothetical protein ACEPAI_7193 [Sanghuangporus weigelae]
MWRSVIEDNLDTILKEFSREYGGSAMEHDLENLQLTALKISSAVVDRLRLPSLKRLVYEDVIGAGERMIFDLILRSDPPLTYLRLSSGSVDKIMLVNVLRLLPTLEELHLSDFIMSARFLRALDMKNEGGTPRREDSSVICPNLQSLRLQHLVVVPQELETCTDALFSLIQSRHAYRPSHNVHLSRTFGAIALPLTDSDHDRLRQELESRGNVLFAQSGRI